MLTLCQNLRREYESLDILVASLTDDQWQQITTFYDWTIYDEIAHLVFFDGAALLAIDEKQKFQEQASELVNECKQNNRLPEVINKMFGKIMPGSELLYRWRETRNALLTRLEAMELKARLPWYGPDMSAKSFATARMMETWAHGQDVYDTLKEIRVNTDRIKNIAHLGVSTFSWSFANRGWAVPETPVRVELISPSGELWAWGPEGAFEKLVGTAEDFCLVVSQRRHLDDTNLKVRGEVVKRWMQIAQCFAGSPADGPKPGREILGVGNYQNFSKNSR